MPQLAGQHPDRQRQVAAQPGDLAHRGIGGSQPGPGGKPGEQCPGFRRGEDVKAEHGRVVQCGQPAAAGDEHQAARGARQQRLDLLVAGGVIEQQKDLLARHVAAPLPGPRVQPRRDLRRGYPGDQQQAGQRIGGVDRPPPGGVGVQRQEELPVREGPGQPVRRMHREGGLADPGHPIDRVDLYHPATSRRRRGQHSHQLRELGLPAGEGGDVARQRPAGRRRERPRHLLPGRQHLGRRNLAAGRGHEQLARRLGQAQRAGQQNAGVLVSGAGDTPLQVTDRTGAQACRLRQLLLRQPGLSAQLPQQPGKTKLRLGHRPSPLTTCPPRPSRASREPPAQTVRQPRRPGHPRHPKPAGQPLTADRRGALSSHCRAAAARICIWGPRPAPEPGRRISVGCSVSGSAWWGHSPLPIVEVSRAGQPEGIPVIANDATLTNWPPPKTAAWSRQRAQCPAGGNFNLFMKAVAGLCHPPAGLRPAPARKERNQP